MMSKVAGGEERARRHDLDALRGFAMLLGIWLHASLSFLDVGWPVKDEVQWPALGFAVAAVHAFRMPLFFLLSGFFAALLWKRMGLRGLLAHRARRVLLPLLLSCITILPVTVAVFERAESRSQTFDLGTDLWGAAYRGDLRALRAFIYRGDALDAPDPLREHTPLAWAVLGGHPAAVDLLLDAGGDPSVRFGGENTALHTAAFFGRDAAAMSLLRAGSDARARNDRGETPLDSLQHGEPVVRAIAAYLGVPAEFERVEAGRAELAPLLGASDPRDAAEKLARAAEPSGLAWVALTFQGLVEKPILHHLWFLWYLCWLLAGFALVVRWLPGRARLPGVQRVVGSPWRLALLVPLSMLPQWFMRGGGAWPGFGPETTSGLLPAPHVLMHHAVFFGAGALLHGAPRQRRPGRSALLHLGAAALVFWPAVSLSLGLPWIAAATGGRELPLVLMVFGEALFAWLVSIGLLGLFEAALHRERRWVRWLSDASYWMYLAHLPLVVWGQDLMRTLPWPAPAKLALLLAASLAILLGSYRWMVRPTVVGTILNGKRAA